MTTTTSLDTMSARAAAHVLGVSPQTVAGLMARREIEYVEIGSRRRIPQYALDDYIARQTRTTISKTNEGA